MKIHCPDCGAEIPAADVNVQTGLAKCAACGSVFDLSQRLRAESFSQTADSELELVPRPPRMRVDEFGGRDFSIRWRWFTPMYFGLLFFCIAWDSFLIFWYAMALRMKHVPWLMVVFPIAHLAVGIGMTYAVLAGFLNSTTIWTGGGELFVRHGPVSWGGNQRLYIGDIAQLFCERQLNRNNNTRTSESFAVQVVMKDGRRVKLASCNSGGEARFLEQTIEQRLGIPNVRVAGELRG